MDATNDILMKLGNISLENLAETLPTALTSDAHILKAEESYNAGKLWDGFHYLSLTHSTLMFHRLSQKKYQLHCSRKSHAFKNDGNTGVTDRPSESNRHNLNDIPNNTSGLRPANSAETKKLLELLPSDWTVVQITSEQRQNDDLRYWAKDDDPITPTLYISRARCGPTPSVIIQKVTPPMRGGAVRSYLHEMELIKGENKVISIDYKNDQGSYIQKRDELNSRLRVLVHSMESGWLKHMSCLLVGCLSPHQESHLMKLVEDAVRKSNLGYSLSQEQMHLLALMLCHPHPATKSTNGKAPFELNVRAGIASILQESVRSNDVKNLSKNLLEDELALLKLRTSTRGPVVLVLDKSIVSLPWEMLQALENQPVTRMPSLPSLVHLYMHHSQQPNSVVTKGIDASNGFFILDPDANLPRTQERLQDTFNSTNWPGIRGKRPSHQEFEEALTTKDVFVYVGHGSGSQYMPAQLVEKLACRSAVFLYGCSSAALASRGSIPDPWGVVLNYLLASCPLVVGMLWEVMDKDTDNLTKEMVRALRGLDGSPGSPLEEPPSDVALLVARARPLCSWYLISAALVVYGLPLQVVPKEE